MLFQSDHNHMPLETVNEMLAQLVNLRSDHAQKRARALSHSDNAPAWCVRLWKEMFETIERIFTYPHFKSFSYLEVKKIGSPPLFHLCVKYKTLGTDDEKYSEIRLTSPARPRVVRPALFTCEGLPWSWVNLKELASGLNMNANDIWERFFALTKDLDKEVIAIVSYDGILRHEGRDFHPHDSTTVYVPAGWALAALDALNKGVHHLIEVDLDPVRSQKEEEPIPGELNRVFTGGGFVAVVGVDKDGNVVD